MIGNRRSGSATWRRVSPSWPFCPPGLRPDFSRRLPVRRRFCFPAGGLLKSIAGRRLAAVRCCSGRFRRSSSSSRCRQRQHQIDQFVFRQEGKGFTIHWILESHHPLTCQSKPRHSVASNLQNLPVRPIQPLGHRLPWAVTFFVVKLDGFAAELDGLTAQSLGLDEPAVSVLNSVKLPPVSIKINSARQHGPAGAATAGTRSGERSRPPIGLDQSLCGASCYLFFPSPPPMPVLSFEPIEDPRMWLKAA